ncbi:MAG TPA: hypothetical protein VM933_09625 [Acidimicrobiales bacterium]|nr:hypothetical protein [Acidimicrobiales bacterium]
MELLAFDAAAGHRVDRFGSDFVLTPLMGPTDKARAVCLHVPPGGRVGEHDAVSGQLFAVVVGQGWVSGGDGVRVPIRPFEAAWWAPGERHAAGTEEGLVAFVIEGDFSVDGLRPTGGS